MKKIIKQYWWVFLLGLLAIIIIPVILQWMMISVLNNTSGGSDDGWLGFWCGYLGAVITVPTTVFVAIWSIRKQIQESKNQFERQIKESKNQFEKQIEENVHQFKEERRINNLSKLLLTIISLRDDTSILIAHLKANGELEEKERTCDNKKRLDQFFNVRFLEFQKEFDTSSVLLSSNDISRKDFLPIKEAIDRCAQGCVSQNKMETIIQDLYKVVDSENRLLEITQNKI